MPEPIEEKNDVKEGDLPDAPIIIDDSKILDEVVGKMPDVVPDALKAAQDKQAETVNIQSQAKDAKGRPFDSNIHESDPSTGSPRLTPTGRFKMKSRPTLSRGPLNIPETDKQVDQKIKMAATKFADVFIVTGISFFGDEWKPESTKDFNERQMLIDANERWMIENGYVEPPAWIDLAMAYGLYAGKRIFQPQTKSRLKIIWEKAKLGATNIWLKLTGKQIKVVSTEKDKEK